jgi:hypothetical protein
MMIKHFWRTTMGYTHYWNGNITPTEFNQLLPIAKAIIKESDVPVQYGRDHTSPPRLSNDTIRLNGVGEDGHETFMIVADEQREFCKTAEKPYDEIVVAILIAASEIAKDFEWRSDGNASDHKRGKQLIASIQWC